MARFWQAVGDDLFAQALQYFRSGRADLAEIVCAEIRSRFPDHAQGLHLSGVIAAQGGRLDVAIAYLERAIRAKSDNPEFHNSMGNALAARGRAAEAVTHYRRALALKPRYPEAIFNLAGVSRELGQREEAETLYRRALGLVPDNVAARLNLGALLAARGALVEAKEQFERALARSPGLAEAHGNLGNVLAELGRLTEAEAELRRALVARSDYAVAHDGLAHVLEQQGRRDEAVTEFRAAVALNPAAPRARIHLGLALAKQGRRKEALVEAEIAARSRGVAGFPHFQLGVLFAECDKREEARTEFQAYLEAEPDDRQGAGMCLAALGCAPAPARAPQRLLEELYTIRASWWDYRNRDAQSYPGARAVAAAFESLAGAIEELEILDAGCGAGLLGALLRGKPRGLDGVDLSPALVSKTKERRIYRRVEQGDLVRYMAARPRAYDAVISSAVLVHFGDLNPVFAAAAETLRDRGLFVFSVFENSLNDESLSVGPAALGLAQTGCYLHHAQYVLRCAAAHGFTLLHQQRDTLDYFEGVARPGLICGFRRSVATAAE